MKQTFAGLTVAVISFFLAFSNSALAQDLGAIVENTVANFTIGGTTFNVFPMLKNSTNPTEQWQFRYEPLFLPPVDANGQLLVARAPNGTTNWNVSFSFAFGTPDANNRAYQKLLAVHPAAAQTLLNNVAHFRVDSIDVSFRNAIPPGLGTLQTTTLNPGAAPTVTVVCTAPSEATSKQLEAWLKSVNSVLHCKYKYGTKKKAENKQAIKFNMLRTSHLFAALDGIPERDHGNVYIHRNDLRKLTENIHLQITSVSYIEDPARFRTDLVQKLIDRFQSGNDTDVMQFNAEKMRATYDADDIKPDKVTKAFEKAFHKNQGASTYHVVKHFLVDTGCEVLGYFGGKAKVEADADETEIKSFLNEKQHGSIL
ncbi:MAG TPA: hypothetical protein VG055_19565 [Planctomycetaceae bacterium]|nr:hypothetical protein [Planctomycetaceae bacterium]